MSSIISISTLLKLLFLSRFVAGVTLDSIAIEETSEVADDIIVYQHKFKVQLLGNVAGISC